MAGILWSSSLAIHYPSSPSLLKSKYTRATQPTQTSTIDWFQLFHTRCMRAACIVFAVEGDYDINSSSKVASRVNPFRTRRRINATVNVTGVAHLRRPLTSQVNKERNKELVPPLSHSTKTPVYSQVVTNSRKREKLYFSAGSSLSARIW